MATSSFLRRAILCPVDFSDDSRAALRHAVALAAGASCPIAVLFVADPLLVTAARTRYGNSAIAGTSLAELRRFGASVIPAAGRVGIEVDYAVATGDPATEIAKAIARTKCDLVVMGTHGLGGLSRLILGSTTEQVLRDTTVPVIVVPPERDDRRRPGPAAWPGGRLLVPVGFGRHAVGEVRAATAIARWFGATLMLVHVRPAFQAPPWFARGGSIEKEQAAVARRQLAGLAARAATGVRVQTRILTGQPAHEIAALAARERAGLIVIPIHAGSVLGRPVGAMIHHVLQHSSTPVLALPAARRRRAR